MKTKQEMLKINELLLRASKAYYMGKTPIMSDKEYDALYDELLNYEKVNGVLPNSASQLVGYEVVSKLTKEPHEQKALSLNKTKNVNELVRWADGEDIVLSWKLDGLTVVATYDNGKLTKAVTRGNGSIGENVTHNAPYFKGLPKTIPYDGHLVVRGEALISYDTFAKINTDGKYSVPRSLASGSVRQLDSKIASKRGIEFIAFELVTPHTKTFADNLRKLKQLGFAVVPHQVFSANDLKNGISALSLQATDFAYPVDGLVAMVNSLERGLARGTTEKYPLYGMAFKWADDTYQTTIRNIEWTASRTGRVNPVCVFDPVEIDGSIVSRATGNNLSFLSDKGIGIGAVVDVYKANMIIPTIDKVVSNPQPLAYPDTCPSCGGVTTVRKGKDGSLVLMCENPDCPAKHLEHFVHFVSRDAMNVVGLSKQTLDMLVSEGLLSNFADLYNIKDHKEILIIKDGFGVKSFNKLCSAIEESRNTTLERVLYAQGIEGVGRHVSKDIAKYCKGSVENFVELMDRGYDWRTIDGVGDVLNNTLHMWWQTGNHREQFINLALVLNFKTPQTDTANESGSNNLDGLTFCVTGKVYQFTNRNELGKWIEDHGGKLTGSVSKKTNYLVNNDVTSTSGKNKKAMDLGVPIISEDDLLKMVA